MRVALLTNAYPPEAYGGAARIAAFQARALASAGYEVRVWCPPIPWFAAHPLARFVRHLRDLGTRPDIVQEIRNWQPDVLITHNLTGCGFSTAGHIQSSGVKWIHVLHDVQLFEPSGKIRQAERITLWQRFWSRARRSVFGHPDLILSPTRWLVDMHRRRGWMWEEARVRVLPHPGPERMHVPRVAHQPFRLLYVGRVADDKGALLLYRLIRELRSTAELFVIGTGPGLKRLKDFDMLATCYGALETPEILSQMEAADVLLVPSQLLENQPTVILEAAALGLPVITSDQPGIRETLDGAGIFCSPASRSQWVMAINRLRDPQVYQDQTARMQQVAEAHDPQMYTKRLCEVVEETLGKRSK